MPIPPASSKSARPNPLTTYGLMSKRLPSSAATIVVVSGLYPRETAVVGGDAHAVAHLLGLDRRESTRENARSSGAHRH